MSLKRSPLDIFVTFSEWPQLHKFMQWFCEACY